MPSLEFSRDGALRGRVALRPGAVTRLGRGEDAEARVEGDAFLSRVHAELTLEAGGLRVRRSAGASNPIFRAGKADDDFWLDPGGSFVIGATSFRFVVDDAAPARSPEEAPPSSERVMEPVELYAVSDRMKLKDLLELPEILRAKDRNDFYFHIAGMIRLATGASWAAVVGADRRVLGRDSQRDDAGFAISARLCERALRESPKPVFHSWRSATAALATATAGTDWAACAAVQIAGGEDLLFYAAGSGGPPSADDPANLDTARYIGLVADIVGRSLSVKRLEEWETRLERFFAKSVVDRLLSGKNLAELEPKLAEATVLFFDIRGFSRLAEDGEIVAFQRRLRRVMTAMTEEILAEEGVVLQYMGDGILACWNVPRPDPAHVERACRAALNMTRRLTEVEPDMRCGIGLHSGRVVAGTIGSEQIFAYGVIGAVINQASRVEGITKMLGTPVIATMAVAAMLPPNGPIAAMPLGAFRPAGMTSDLELCELTAAPVDAARAAAFTAAVAALRVGRWEEAARALDARPADDRPARYLADFARKCGANPPADWRGVIGLSEK